MSDRRVLFSPFEVVEAYLIKKNAVLALAEVCDNVYWKLPHESMGSIARANLLHYRINRISHLIDSCGAMYGREVVYWLHVHLDSHIHMVLEIEETGRIKAPRLMSVVHEKIIPDYANDAMRASFPYHKHPARWFASVSSIFSKCMPENGQPRSLNAFIVKVLSKGDDMSILDDSDSRRGGDLTKDCMCQLITCSMMGNYMHCDYRPPFSIRKNIIRDVTRNNIIPILRSGHPESMLLYYIVREYISVIAKYVPPFADVMERSVLWGKQTGRIRDIMRCMRQQAVHLPEWQSVFSGEGVANQMRKHYKRMPKKKIRKRKPEPGMVFKTILHRTISRRRKKWSVNHVAARQWFGNFVNGVWVRPIKDLFLSNGLEGEHNRVLLTLAHDIYIKFKSVHKFGKLENIEQVPVDRLLSMYDFVLTANNFESITHVRLPRSIAEMQIHAICQRFSCDPTDTLTIGRAARVKVCPGCYGIRNFYIMDDEASGCKLIKAQGYTSVVSSAFEDYHPELVCCEKPSCRNYELFDFTIVSRGASGTAQSEALQIGDQCITVSPCCGILCSTNHIHCTAGGFACPSCIMDSQRTESDIMETDEAEQGVKPLTVCMLCLKEIKNKHMSCVMIDEQGEKSIRSFCKRHWRQWYARDPPQHVEHVKKQYNRFRRRNK